MPLTDYQLFAYLGRARFTVRLALPEPAATRWIREPQTPESGATLGASLSVQRPS